MTSARRNPRGRRGSSAVGRYLRATSNPGLSVDGPSQTADGPFAMAKMQTLERAPADAGADNPDLLHPERAICLDRRTLTRALEFAFAAGDAAGCAGQALDRAAIATSDFLPDAFAADLFVDELLDKCMTFSVDGKRARLARAHLRRLISQPPADPTVTEFRQAIVAELDQHPALQQALLATYRQVAELVRLFDESGGHSRLDLPRWRLDLLACLRKLFESLQGPFAQTTSGLRRLEEFGHQVGSSTGMRDLCALLDFEGDLARVDLHLRLGIDGRIRQLDVRNIAEEQRQPFYRGPVARLWLRLSMWLRGYRVGESELVERWFDHVYAGILPFLPTVLQLRGDLEFYLAACHMRQRARDAGLATCLPTLETAPVGPRVVRRLFNPLLLNHDRPPVPCDLNIASFDRLCVVTGPNSGGKTRLLQAIGLVQLLGQAGLAVTAEQASLRWASGLFVSLGQEATAQQTEGRLGTELTRIRGLFERANPRSLVILDELCSGTNPSEGEEIFHLVAELLHQLEPEAFITTHFLKFAGELAAEADALSLCFLQVELDAHETPTYQFVDGVATTSLAHKTAARLGVTREELLALIAQSRRRAGGSQGPP